jgi:hypothetical protein
MDPLSASGPSNHSRISLDQRKRALHAGVAAGTRGHGDQAVGALLDRLVREGVVDDVVQHHAAPGVHGVVDVGARAQAGDDDGHLVLGADLHVVLEPVVGLVHDLVDGNGAAGWSGWSRFQAASASVISASHSSSCDAGRAFSDGMEPTTPALHCAITSLGLLMMNSGEPMMGSGRFCSTGGRRGAHQKDSRARAVTASAPSTMLSRRPGALLRMCSA